MSPIGLRIAILALLILPWLPLPASAELAVGRLRCEYLENPLGIDVPRPRLSWVLQSPERGQRQTAYQVLVSSSPQQLSAAEGDLWDSGRVESDQSIQVEYSGAPLRSGRRCHWKVRAWDAGGQPSPWSEPGTWTMGRLHSGDWSARWICAPFGGGTTAGAAPDRLTEMPLLRKAFRVDGKVQSALLYVTSLGFHEVLLNGRRVGDHLFDPVQSDFSRRVYYVTHDVSEEIACGQNIVGVALGKGWYWQGVKGVTRDRPALLLQIDITLTDGRSIQVVSDGSWRTAPAARQHMGGWRNSAFGGELLDARRDQPDWSGPHFDDSAWQAVETASVADLELSAQMVQPNRQIARFEPESIRDLGANEYLVDVGRNLTGWFRIKFRGHAGQEITFRYSASHHQNDDPLEEHFGQVDRYICRGEGQEEFCPQFNWRAFRYVKISGLAAKPALADMEAILISTSTAPTSTFACSDPLLNRLHETVRHTHRCLTLGAIQVDCPHRERLGYGAEGLASLDQALFNFDSPPFYTKWARDFQDGQDPDSGVVNHTAPFRIPYAGGGPAWSGACVVFPWSLYLHYGDRRILEEHYPSIRKWLACLDSHTEGHLLKPYGLPRMDIWQFLGDWASPRRKHDTLPCSGHWASQRENRLFNDCHHYLQVSLASRIADILDQPDDAERYRAECAAIKRAIQQEYFDASQGRFSQGEQQQPYLALPLLLDIVPDEDRSQVLGNLVDDILVTRSGHLDFGVLGGRYTLDALVRERRSDLIYKMATRTTWPGWGDMLEQGATTLWEHWLPGDSSIHNSFLSIGSWFFSGLAGIRPDPEAAGFKRVLIEPQMAPGIRWVRASYDSIHGPLAVEWKAEDARLSIDVSISPNTTARVALPASIEAESGRALAQSPGVTLVRTEPGRTVVDIQSGKYRFTSR